eukprot:TRINITY_DN513_c0_g1_i1.p1 TRINITY_DN513_c0_g1~~TRINITY_DN513_c0_g1_i1.p1  ORF type:complete len:488 (+),score=203.39 TRINITY_DN513_c0_g1_i1:58-1464(+)
MRTAALAALAVAGPVRADDFYSSWMGKIAPAAGNLSVLDMALPGTHDSMTWDLSNTVADDTNDLPTWASWILHNIHDLFYAAEFIHEQAQTQGLSVLGQLQTGVRFIDMRMTFTAPPKDSSLHDYDWYSIHLVESNQPVYNYFKDIKSFLDTHPTEVVVVWLTKHGSSCPKGTDQYPGAKPADKQKLWGKLKALFGDMMFNRATSLLNETSYDQMIARGERIVFYLADFDEVTGGNETRAYDACKSLSNNLHGGSLANIPGTIGGWKNALKGAGAKRKQLKANDQFFLMSFAGTPPSDQIQDAGIIRYIDWFKVEKEATMKKCAKTWNMPSSVVDWCPLTLEDAELFRNYYSQRALDMPINSSDYAYPGAIYIDGVAENGLLRTGTTLIGQQGMSLMQVLNRTEVAGDHGTAGWSYVASLALWTVRQACAGKSSASCSSLAKELQGLHDANPVQKWDDAAHGRLASWP